MISRAVTTTITVAGMTSVHAVRAVFTALAAVEGITHADVGMGRVTVEHDGGATEAALREAIGVAGFEVLTVTQTRRKLRLMPDEKGPAE